MQEESAQISKSKCIIILFTNPLFMIDSHFRFRLAACRLGD